MEKDRKKFIIQYVVVVYWFLCTKGWRTFLQIKWYRFPMSPLWLKGIRVFQCPFDVPAKVLASNT